MKSIKLTLLLIALTSDLSLSKKFELCEFAQELFIRHKVPFDEVYMHLCIGSSLHTGQENHGSTFVGIYAIGTQWWCGDQSAGGTCNVKCSDLLDDDIADDVACANIILSSHGLQGWHATEASCKRRFEHKVEECLTDIDIMTELRLVGSSDQLNTTTTTTTTTSRPTSQRPANLAVTEVLPQATDVRRDQGISFTVIILVASLLLILIATVIVVKREQVKRYLSSQRNQNQEFENALII